MASPGSINLLRSTTGRSPDITEWEGRLRIIAIVVLALIIVSGLAIGVTYTLFSSQKSILEEDRSRLIKVIDSQAQKEILLANIKERLAFLDKIFSTQMTWEKIVATILSFAQSPRLQTISVSDKHLVTFTVFSSTFEETKAIVDAVAALSREQKIKNPLLETMQVDKTGSVQLAISFTPVRL